MKKIIFFFAILLLTIILSAQSGLASGYIILSSCYIIYGKINRKEGLLTTYELIFRKENISEEKKYSLIWKIEYILIFLILRLRGLMEFCICTKIYLSSNCYCLYIKYIDCHSRQGQVNFQKRPEISIY